MPFSPPRRIEIASSSAGRIFFAIYGDRVALFIINFHIGGLIGAFSGTGQDEHVLRRLHPGIFQDAPFKAYVQQVAVAAVGFCVRHRHGDPVLLCILDYIRERDL